MRAPLDPEPGFTATRKISGSDRFVPGTRPNLLEWYIYGDVPLDKGVIVTTGYIPRRLSQRRDLEVVDVDGKWISPGLVDVHSHLGVHPAPGLQGSADGNSHKAPILPWIRSIDGLNTHDDAYGLAVAGGVTTAQVLPGSADNIGNRCGQAFLIKLRPTAECSTSILTLSGENPDRLYKQTRMDTAWNFRHAYNEALKIKKAQDAFCDAAEHGAWDGKTEFPESFQWESLVDVLRVRVKLSVHCYEAVDLDALIRLSNEFEFPIACIHHAAWGNVPAIALFASNFRKKRDAYRGSEFAPRILADIGLPVIMKSDHPVLNSCYLMYEAQQAHYYSLNPALALASVTSTPAAALGVGWRVGTIAEDLVIWGSHPLALGATPVQVYIDGIPQLKNASVSHKSHAFEDVPQTPSREKEVKETIEYEGLPPLEGRSVKGTALFVAVRNVWLQYDAGIQPLVAPKEESIGTNLTVVVRAGKIECYAHVHDNSSCGSFAREANVEVVDLKGGSLAPGLSTFGSDLGLSEIMLEPSTTDGPVFDPLTMRVPSILGHSVIRAVDGLRFGDRNSLYAYRSGVTTAVVAPMGNGFLRGVATAFDLGSNNSMAKGAIVQEETSLHISLHSQMQASVSTQMAALRKLLSEEGATGPWLRVRKGEIPLVISDAVSDHRLRLTFSGAIEAHLLAKEIGAAGVSVILSPARPYPGTWDTRRILPGPPLSRDTATTTLLKQNVNVALGANADYDARNARFEIAWALGLQPSAKEMGDIVIFQGGGAFDLESKVVGVPSSRGEAVNLF
ncbi:hypothetical protein B0H10DRAFT_2164595 [Mycena sp. CBHHK59/15]|nr:hypothetical protein B0H10DRAFT_2164595 [Mycena sp. CBHHK59/15]